MTFKKLLETVSFEDVWRELKKCIGAITME